MTGLYESLVRPFLFEFESERIHDFTLDSLGFAGGNGLLCDAVASLFKAPPLPTDVFGFGKRLDSGSVNSAASPVTNNREIRSPGCSVPSRIRRW